MQAKIIKSQAIQPVEQALDWFGQSFLVQERIHSLVLRLSSREALPQKYRVTLSSYRS